MKDSPWQRRLRRAQELAAALPFAAEILGFYVHVARFQNDLHQQVAAVLQSAQPSINRPLGSAELAELTARFESFLQLAETHGPEKLSLLSRELHARGHVFWSELLNQSWTDTTASDPPGLLALAFLQPYAELLRSRSTSQSNHPVRALCPFCSRKPVVGALRQMGDGGARSLVCSFCLAEWDFRRIVCPGCGEENNKMLPVFTASDFDYIRIECCETCKTYLKTVDLTRNGRAEPVVDELASAPLDLWAHDRGYAKLQTNLLGM